MLMGWSLEGRVPFLDHRVVEFGLGLPDHLKVNGNQGKSFLRHWAAKHLPAGHLGGPKRGFYVPIGEWTTGRYVTALADVLPRHPAIRNWFRAEGVKELIAKCPSSVPATRLVWALLQFGIWYQLFIVGQGQRPPVNADPLEVIAGG
jgi:asparagine synthase (glutamine-hydrolysing)